jgi:hypothetical protein
VKSELIHHGARVLAECADIISSINIMKTKFILPMASVLAFLTIGTVQAAPKKSEAKAEAPATPAKNEAKGAKRDTYPLWGEVVAVNAKSLTIKGGEGKEDRKYAISTDTKIHNNGKPATVEDIKVGKKVGGLIKKADGDDQMVSINVGVKQERAEGADKKAEGKKPAEEAKAKKKAQ